MDKDLKIKKGDDKRIRWAKKLVRVLEKFNKEKDRKINEQ